MNIQYASIIIDIVLEKLDRTFQYRIPDALQQTLRIGMEVNIPFGKGNRVIRGYVIDITNQADYAEDKLKDIISICDSSLKVESQMIQLAYWIRETYGSTMIQALKTVLPIHDKVKEKENNIYQLNIPANEAQRLLAIYEKKNAKAKVRLLHKLMEDKQIDSKTIKNVLKISSGTLQAMMEDEVIAKKVHRIYRNPIENIPTLDKDYVLTEEQQFAVNELSHDFENGIRKTYLLHGVTGSGKTEVYMEMISSVVKHHLQAIVLIPEIALTYQTVSRFYQKFQDRVSVIHSKLSKGEKYDTFLRAQNKELDVIIGPRSALFTPFSRLGLIIIDEEHESGYKSETVPKYHARETAIARASICGASVVLGSATPSLEAYTKALSGEYKLLELTKRIGRQGLATVYIEDLRQELKEGNRSIFSRRLRSLINDRLKRKEQILLFLNRRGYAGFISCRSCGNAVKCPHCDVSLSLHKNGKLICHYCGYEQSNIKVCPTCGSKYIGGFKAGTEQVEEIVKREFPKAKVLRMDMDTTRTKNGHQQIVSAFSKQQADILIGTQMIVKGHDFPNVTLVGILAADMSLQVGNYTAAERTFQLLTQAAGRAGRGNLAGEVVIQTYNPEHYAVTLAKEQDYKAFYEQEMKYRTMLLYPPAGSILEIFLSGPVEEAVIKTANQIKQKLNDMLLQVSQQYQLIGPAPAVIARLNDQFRQVLYLKALDKNMLLDIRKKLESYPDVTDDEVIVQFDINGL